MTGISAKTREQHTAVVLRKGRIKSALGISDATYYRLIGRGELDLVKVGPRASGVTCVSFARYCEQHGIPLPANGL